MVFLYVFTVEKNWKISKKDSVGALEQRTDVISVER